MAQNSMCAQQTRRGSHTSAIKQVIVSCGRKGAAGKQAVGRKVGSVLDHELKGFVTPKEDVDTAVWIRGKARSEEPAWGGREFEATGQVGL